MDRRDGYRAEVDRGVMTVGCDLGWVIAQLNTAARICYRAVTTECHWRLYANIKVAGSIGMEPNDGYPAGGGDQLSVGLYQQQAQWWGDTAGSMDPHTSTVRFLRHMTDNVADWLTADPSDVCQRVQQSQFDAVTINPATGAPFPYAANYRAEDVMVEALALDVSYFTHHAT